MDIAITTCKFIGYSDTGDPQQEPPGPSAESSDKNPVDPRSEPTGPAGPTAAADSAAPSESSDPQAQPEPPRHSARTPKPVEKFSPEFNKKDPSRKRKSANPDDKRMDDDTSNKDKNVDQEGANVEDPKDKDGTGETASAPAEKKWNFDINCLILLQSTGRWNEEYATPANLKNLAFASRAYALQNRVAFQNDKTRKDLRHVAMYQNALFNMFLEMQKKRGKVRIYFVEI